MSMQSAGSGNQISYKSFCDLGGVDNPSLIKVQRHNGAHSYTTYHHVGYRQARHDTSLKTTRK